jgi:hypothetical protein
MPLPTDAKERKDIPIFSGFISYFPDAIIEVTKVSKRGNDQHNPGKPLHWDRSKSRDELDALTRHLVDSTRPGISVDEKIADAAARTWRSLADLQKLCEARQILGVDKPRVRANVHAEMRKQRLESDGAVEKPYSTGQAPVTPVQDKQRLESDGSEL